MDARITNNSNQKMDKEEQVKKEWVTPEIVDLDVDKTAKIAGAIENTTSFS